MNTLNEVLEMNGIEPTDELLGSIVEHFENINILTTLECGEDDFLIVTVECNNMPAHVIARYFKKVRDSMSDATGRKVIVLPSTTVLSVLKVA